MAFLENGGRGEGLVTLGPAAERRELPDARPAPLVSVVMANYAAAAYLPAALKSVLGQTAENIEVIVSDDASPDDSRDVVRQFCRSDSRVTLIEADRNAGPGAARNRALAAARGEWIAVVDSDDILHPRRFEILLSQADRLGADIVADDLLYFSTSGKSGASLFGGHFAPETRAVSAELFVRANTAGSGLPPLGYLKPLFRRQVIGKLRYDESTPIGEDYDFLLRAMIGGAKLHLVPNLLYFYRRYQGSISHRLSVSTVTAMLDNQDRMGVGAMTPALHEALDRRRTALQASLAFEKLIEAIKSWNALAAASLLARRPGLTKPLLRSIGEHFSHRAPDAEITRSDVTVAVGGGELAAGSLDTVSDLLGFGRVSTTFPVALEGPLSAPDRETCASLIAFGASRNVKAIAVGIAGLDALPYLMAEESVCLIDDPAEVALAIKRAARSETKVILSPAVHASVPNVITSPIGGGFEIIEAAAGSVSLI